jgi:F0F1-type ATP synthase assembly protein I
MARGNDGDQNALNYGLYPAVGVGIGMAIGYWADRKFGWGNAGLLAGGVIGMASGLYMLIKEGTRMNKD